MLRGGGWPSPLYANVCNRYNRDNRYNMKKFRITLDWMNEQVYFLCDCGIFNSVRIQNFAQRIFFAQVLKFILVNFNWYLLLFYGNETILKLNGCFQGFLWMSTFTECVINYSYFCCCLKKLVTFRPNMQALRSRFALGSTPRAPQFPERLKGGRLEKWKVGIDCCDLWVQFNCLRDVWLVKNRPSF